MDPIIYLGIDNCFASKRWVRPDGLGAGDPRPGPSLCGGQRGHGV